LPHFLGDAARSFGFNDPNGEAAKSGDVFRTVTYPYSTAILVTVPIDDVVAPVLDGLVLPVDLKHMLRGCLFGGSTGNAIGSIQRDLARFLLYAVTLHDECLSNMREVEIVVEFRGCPDLSCFNSSVIRRCILNKLRLLSIPEEQLQILQNSGLVSLDSEMVVGFSLRDQILG
jgi:hypothetical protein